ncbi:MAG TPA: UDP-glucose 4-epimerase, partial [Acidobacteriota bacterium]|nr:UDP-glucose 4-epimerase [Acidobacteriota bacterium]
GVETTVVDIFHHLREASGLDIAENHGPAKAGEQLRSVLTSRKLFEHFGWKPQMPIAEGLKLTLESFRQPVQ